MKLNDSVTVHDAVTSWTESINTKNFTVCVMQSGRKEESANPFATIDWIYGLSRSTKRRIDGYGSVAEMVVWD